MYYVILSLIKYKERNCISVIQKLLIKTCSNKEEARMRKFSLKKKHFLRSVFISFLNKIMLPTNKQPYAQSKYSYILIYRQFTVPVLLHLRKKWNLHLNKRNKRKIYYFNVYYTFAYLS